MDNKLCRALALSISLGCSGCATDADLTQPSPHKVTARVIDMAPARPGALADQEGVPGVRSPVAKLPAPPSKSPPKVGPIAATTPEPIRLEQYSYEDGDRPAGNLEPRNDIEPPPNPEEQFLMRVAAERPAVPLNGSVNGEAALANFISGDNQCSKLAITYPIRRVSEIWRVCADRQFVLEKKAEPTPAVPDDPGLEATRRIAVHSAYNDGRATVPYGPFSISAQAGGLPDVRGCMLIRSALSWQGVPVATSDETICVPPGE